jgi:integrase/recombinase XerD
MNDNKTKLDLLHERYIRECLTLRGCSLATIRAYKRAFIEVGKVGHPTDESSAVDTISALVEKGLKPGTVNNYATAYTTFIYWLANKKESDRFKLPTIPNPKTKKPIFTADQVLNILRCKIPKRCGGIKGMERARLMFALCLDTACRWGEIVSILRSDVDANNGILQVQGKSGLRTVPISIEGIRIIKKAISLHQHERVFCTFDTGGMLEWSNSTRELKQLFEVADVPTKLGCWHNIRRFALRSYVASGAGIRGAQLLAGHSESRTTAIYLDADTELMSLPHQQWSPLAKLTGQRR